MQYTKYEHKLNILHSRSDAVWQQRVQGKGKGEGEIRIKDVDKDREKNMSSTYWACVSDALTSSWMILALFKFLHS